MCSTPKAPKPAADKPVQYLRNPYLDGLTIGGGTAQGRNSLRIDPGSAGTATPGSGGSGLANPNPPLIPTPRVPGLVIPTAPPRSGGGGAVRRTFTQ